MSGYRCFPKIKKVKMGAFVKENSWLGIGFGSGMMNTDMITFSGEGQNGKAVDQYSSGY